MKLEPKRDAKGAITIAVWLKEIKCNLKDVDQKMIFFFFFYKKDPTKMQKSFHIILTIFKIILKQKKDPSSNAIFQKRNEHCHLSKIPKIVTRFYFKVWKPFRSLLKQKRLVVWNHKMSSIYCQEGERVYGWDKITLKFTMSGCCSFPISNHKSNLYYFFKKKKAWPEWFSKPEEVLIRITIATKPPDLDKVVALT